jgi:chromosome segregation ATPase
MTSTATTTPVHTIKELEEKIRWLEETNATLMNTLNGYERRVIILGDRLERSKAKKRMLKNKRKELKSKIAKMIPIDNN